MFRLDIPTPKQSIDFLDVEYDRLHYSDNCICTGCGATVSFIKRDMYFGIRCPNCYHIIPVRCESHGPRISCGYRHPQKSESNTDPGEGFVDFYENRTADECGRTDLYEIHNIFTGREYITLHPSVEKFEIAGLYHSFQEDVIDGTVIEVHKPDMHSGICVDCGKEGQVRTAFASKYHANTPHTKLICASGCTWTCPCGQQVQTSFVLQGWQYHPTCSACKKKISNWTFMWMGHRIRPYATTEPFSFPFAEEGEELDMAVFYDSISGRQLLTCYDVWYRGCDCTDCLTFPV